MSEQLEMKMSGRIFLSFGDHLDTSLLAGVVWPKNVSRFSHSQNLFIIAYLNSIPQNQRPRLNDIFRFFVGLEHSIDELNQHLFEYFLTKRLNEVKIVFESFDFEDLNKLTPQCIDKFLVSPDKIKKKWREEIMKALSCTE